MLFCGPTGTNAVETALKLARKATGRKTVVSFLNGFHGMTAGSMAVSRRALTPSDPLPPIGGTVFLPYDGARGKDCDTLDELEDLLAGESNRRPPASSKPSRPRAVWSRRPRIGCAACARSAPAPACF